MFLKLLVGTVFITLQLRLLINRLLFRSSRKDAFTEL
jgi:hypothetical protein